MTDQEINIKIAEACGWFKHHCGACERITAHRPDGGCNNHGDGYKIFPSYCGDLNEMRAAKATLTPKQQYDFTVNLRETIHKAGIDACNFYLINASAKHQAEAFIKTIEND